MVQHIRPTLPLGVARPGQPRIRLGRRARGPGVYRQQQIRMLRLGAVRGSIHTEQRGDRRIRPMREGLQPPAQQRRRIRQRRHRVADVELAIAIGTLAVFPRLAPVDGGQPEQRDRPVRGWARSNGRPLFQQMRVRPVVIHPIREIGQRAADEIALRRVQIAAGRVAAQRPAVRPVLFPGRQAEREFQQTAQPGPIQRCWKHRPRPVQIPEGHVGGGGRERQRDFRAPVIAPEGIGLGVPVQRLGPRGVAVEMMPGALVVLPGRDADRGFAHAASGGELARSPGQQPSGGPSTPSGFSKRTRYSTCAGSLSR